MHPNPVSNRPAVRSNRFRQQSSKGLFSGRAILCNFLAWRFYDFQSDGWLSLVEGTGFENRRRGNSSGGSNPSPSALSLIGVFQMSSRLSKLNGLCGSPHFKFCTRWFDRNLATNSAKLKQNGHCYFSCELLAVSIRSGHQWGWGGYLLRHSTVY